MSKDNETKPMTLAAKLARIGYEIGVVKKSGTNMQQKYNYIEYGVVAGRIRELFDKYGVIIVPEVVDYKTDEITNKYDNKGYHYVLKMRFTLINGDDRNDFVMSNWLGESADYGDKGVNKAETAGTKYFLMRLFNVSEKGEEEADKVTPEITATRRVNSSVSREDIDNAKATLDTVENLDELKQRFISLGKMARVPEIIDYKDELKKQFIESDPEARLADAKEKLDKQFNK